MTTATIAAPEQLLASEPVRRDGLKTPLRKEGDRTIKYTWTVGDGPLWRTDHAGEQATFHAVLVVTHTKGRNAHYSATLWQHHGEAGSMCVLDGRNGYMILRDSAGAGRFSLNKLQAFAPYALAKLQGELKGEPEILAYFKPERV